ncbi:hypothetical protein K469DRAFT_592417 [Zopfia rhizophila CBS 207.26]|uniref:Uncharacterized protein n=1 Tax=Zopfia rhizophila CBS 207.26 TaxID=1314779 RepID=A0A6A6DPR4_9PEZI|nr:hypothetical protein K469DRAFT_592417 [Zopfia rhizophila CBS 207.26]
MQLKLLIILLPATMALPNAAPAPQPHPVTLPNVPDPPPRQCDYNARCTSATGIRPGLYCGYCSQVQGRKDPTFAYQLTGRGGQRSCCSFGVRNSCRRFWENREGRRECPIRADGK